MSEISSKIEDIENEMDIRVDSLIIQLQNIRDKNRHRLNEYKKIFST